MTPNEDPFFVEQAREIIARREADPYLDRCLTALMNHRAPDPLDGVVLALAFHGAVQSQQADGDDHTTRVVRKRMGLAPRVRGADPAFDPASYTVDHPVCAIVIDLQAGRINREAALQAFAEIIDGSRVSRAKLLDGLLEKWRHLPRLPERPRSK